MSEINIDESITSYIHCLNPCDPARSFAAVFALCGSYEAGAVTGISEVYPKRVRMVDSATIYTEADLTTIG